MTIWDSYTTAENISSLCWTARMLGAADLFMHSPSIGCTKQSDRHMGIYKYLLVKGRKQLYLLTLLSSSLISMLINYLNYYPFYPLSTFFHSWDVKLSTSLLKDDQREQKRRGMVRGWIVAQGSKIGLIPRCSIKEDSPKIRKSIWKNTHLGIKNISL